MHAHINKTCEMTPQTLTQLQYRLCQRIARLYNQQRRQRQAKRHSKVNIWEMVTMSWLFSSFFTSFIVERARYKGTGRSAVEVNIMKDFLLWVHAVVKTLNLEISRWHWTKSKNCTKVSTCTCGAIFFLIQPIRSFLLKLSNNSNELSY